MILHRLSNIFQPMSLLPKDALVKKQNITAKSQKLMLELGVIRQANPGCFHFLPLGVKALNKLINLVHNEMEQINGQKVIFPTLTNAKLWQTTGRLQSVASELFKVKDRHNQNYIMSPTHEEAATDLIHSISPISYKQLPLKLYQITNKYRDEMKPRFGLIRAKQFLMKDMYSFDIDVQNALNSYKQITDAYDTLLKQIGVPYTRVLGASGNMGGNLSHEYHFHTTIGEDRILKCSKCDYRANVVVSGEKECPECKSESIEIANGIEVGHTFLLGDKYSKPLKAAYLQENGKAGVVQMGSYGLGISRLLAASIEVLSSESEIRWPALLTPYQIVIIPPKGGSKEERHFGADTGKIEALYSKLSHLDGFKDNVLVDDRLSMTIGKRFMEAKRFGYPFVVVLGKRITEDPPLYELIDIYNSKQYYLNENDLILYFQKSK